MSAAANDILLDQPGARRCLLGNLAIVRGALEAGVQFYSCYPGTPSSEIGDTFARIASRAGVQFEYSVNEKVAVEVAFAASLAGARAMCGMKHLGLSYACDPVSTMPYVGVEGGLVIVSAGDPSAITSPNEQDQRHFSKFLYYPVFDPATPEDARRMTRCAFELSEATRLPVILRPTTRVCHSSGVVEFGPLPQRRNTIAFRKNPARYVPIPSNARRMRTELTARHRQAARLLRETPFFTRSGGGRRGIIASGIAWAYATQVLAELGAAEQVTLQQIGAYPIPDEVLSEFLAGVDSVLVLEELTPFLEEAVMLAAYRQGRQLPIFGKHSGHLPLEFEYSPDLVEDAVRSYLELAPRKPPAVSVPELPPRPPVLCPGCPHRASFYLVNRVFGKQTVYCNDIGCYTLGYGEPLHACDTVLCMGSSISQASAIARLTRRRTVAYIGDSTFFHSGLPALANAVQADDPITVVILDNYITAMTGFQPSLTTGSVAKPAGRETERADAPDKPTRFSIEAACRGLGVREVYSIDPFDEAAARATLEQARKAKGTNVVVSHAPCLVFQRRGGDAAPAAVPFAIDEQLCNACGLCVRLLGCPAIVVTAGGQNGQRFAIDQELCVGCALCARVCQRDAIHAADPGEP